MNQIQPSAHWFWTSIGPRARPGFMAAPVSGPPMRMSAAIVRPMAKPAIDREGATRVGRGREDDPDEEEGQDRLEDEAGRSAEIWALSAGAPSFAASLTLSGIDPLEEQRRGDRAAELGGPVAERRAAASMRRVRRKPSVTAGLKCAAGDVSEGRDHDREDETVGDRDAEQVATARHDRAGADEDEREGADELCDRPAEVFAFHGREASPDARIRQSRPANSSTTCCVRPVPQSAVHSGSSSMPTASAIRLM